MTAINGTGAPQGIDSVLNILGADDLYANREELMGLFEDVNFYNEGNEGKDKIEKKIEDLEEKIKNLETAAQDTLNKITEQQEGLDKKQDELVTTSKEMFNSIHGFQEKAEKASKLAVTDAIKEYNKYNGQKPFAQCFEGAFYNALNRCGAPRDSYAAKLLSQRFDEQKAVIDGICGDIQWALDEVKNKKGQLQNIQGTISMLTRTKTMMQNSTVDDAYKNIDTDTNIPHYSGAKAEIANELLAKYNPQFDKGTARTDYTEKELSVMNDYKPKENSEKYTKGDIYRADQNPELKHLNEAIGKGMLKDLKDAGLGKEEIMKFITDNWNVGIKEKDGKWSIPYGHGVQGTDDRTKTKATYQAISDMLGGAATANDVNPHQLERLQKAVNDDDILRTMYENGFTFKEAMYTLTQIFPDAGITYNVENQSPERNYGLVDDSNQSKNLYSNIAGQIKDFWNVDATKSNSGGGGGSNDGPRHDPFTFETEDGTVTLIHTLDEQGNFDGKFDYNSATDNDLVGSKNGVEELLALDTDGDMKLTAEELQAGGVMFMVNNQKESVANETDVDNYWKEGGTNGADQYTNAVDFEVSYKTAEMMGVDYIDLNGMVTGTGAGEDVATSTKNYDGTQEHFEDINGSSVINTFGVNFTDGTTIEGKETLNTKSNLEKFYKTIADSQKPGGEYASSITVSLGDEADDYFNDGIKGSEKIDNIIDKLEDIQRWSKIGSDVVQSNYGTNITAAQVQELVGEGHLSAMEDKARKAAEEKLDLDGNTDEYSNEVYAAKDEAAEAIQTYFYENIYTTKELEEAKKLDKNNK